MVSAKKVSNGHLADLPPCCFSACVGTSVNTCVCLCQLWVFGFDLGCVLASAECGESYGRRGTVQDWRPSCFSPVLIQPRTSLLLSGTAAASRCSRSSAGRWILKPPPGTASSVGRAARNQGDAPVNARAVLVGALSTTLSATGGTQLLWLSGTSLPGLIRSTLHRKHDREPGATAGEILSLDLAAVCRDDRPADCQPEALAWHGRVGG